MLVVGFPQKRNILDGNTPGIYTMQLKSRNTIFGANIISHTTDWICVYLIRHKCKCHKMSGKTTPDPPPTNIRGVTDLVGVVKVADDYHVSPRDVKSDMIDEIAVRPQNRLTHATESFQPHI